MDCDRNICYMQDYNGGCETCPCNGHDESMSNYKAQNEMCTKTYEEGLADAWEAARKINCFVGNGGISTDDKTKIFGMINLSDIMKNYTPQEAIAKIKEWEDSKEIKRGDEVIHVMDRHAKMIVTYIAADGDFIHGVNKIGDLYSCTDPDNWRKTGRNFADKLDALLMEIGGNNG